jgi:ankyrin repeat protein
MATKDPYGRWPLHYAALKNDVEAARRLLADGADPNAADKAGFTPLHFAAQEYSVAVSTAM